MKSILASILVLSAALSVPVNSIDAAPTRAAAIALPVGTVENNGWEISVGSPVRHLLNRFGSPNEKLTTDIWVYHGYHPVQKRAQAFNCGTLIITLADGKVASIQIVNPRAQAIITARLQTASGSMVAKGN